MDFWIYLLLDNVQYSECWYRWIPKNIKLDLFKADYLELRDLKDGLHIELIGESVNIQVTYSNSAIAYRCAEGASRILCKV